MSGESGAGGAPPPRGGWRLGNLKGPEWRTAAWMGGLLVAGLLLLVSRPGVGSPQVVAANPGGATGGGGGAPQGGGAQDPLQAEAQAMGQGLEQALTRIAGAGTVTVRLRLEAGPVTEYATNTQQTDSSSSGSGGTTSQRTVSRQLASPSGGGTPPVQSTKAASIASVLVVASGASDPRVRAELAAAVQAATGASLYRIVVLPAGGAADG